MLSIPRFYLQFPFVIAVIIFISPSHAYTSNNTQLTDGPLLFSGQTAVEAGGNHFGPIDTATLFTRQIKPETEQPIKFTEAPKQPRWFQLAAETPTVKERPKKDNHGNWRSWLVYSNNYKQLMPKIATLPTLPKIISFSLTRNVASDFANNHALSNFPVDIAAPTKQPSSTWTSNDTYQICALIAHAVLVMVISFFASREIIFQLKRMAKARRRALRKYRY